MRSKIQFPLLVALALAAAFPAFAIDYPCADNETTCGRQDTFDTEGGDTGGYKPPEISECKAYKVKGQRCRDCVENYAPDGQPSGVVCGFVDYSAACDCVFKPLCTRKATCTYISGW